MYCEGPENCDCKKAKTCDDINEEVMDLMSEYDTNGDGQINLGDNID